MSNEILTACIAAAAAWLIAVLAKEQKTSEFRQAWIDSLRTELSELVAIKTHVCLLAEAKLRLGGTADLQAYILSQAPELTKAQAMYERVRMRLNPDEARNTLLLTQLKRLVDLTPGGASHVEVNTLADEIAASSRPILKQEWVRVKRGELTFRVTEAVALLVVILGVVYATGHVTISWT
jgi:hypothetical protein